jgi:hypothetical protein
MSDNIKAASPQVLIVKSILANAAEWRQFKAKEFPDDKRNSRAAALLETLSDETADSVPANILNRLDAVDGPTLSRVGRTVSQRVAFRDYPASLAAFIELVLSAIARESV